MKRMRRLWLTGFILAVAAGQACAQLHVQAGGGLHVPSGDSARFVERGYRLGAGIEWKPGQVGILLDGAYNRDNVNSEECEKTFRENHPAFPATAPLSIDGVAQVIELNISPKFYLLDTENIGAYLIAGGGPRWVRKRVNIDLPPSPNPAMQDQHMKASETSLGVQVGFGVEAAFPGGLRLGLNPLYHFVFAKHRVQYAALTAYLKL
jgi:hypothetical protein